MVYPRVVKEVCFLVRGCEVVSARLPQSERYPVSPGPGELLRSGLGWTPLLRSPSSGVWLFLGGGTGGAALGCAGVHSGLGGSGFLPHSMGGRTALSLFMCVWTEQP